MKNKKLNVELTELFMAKAGKTDFTRCFHGIIKRWKDESGKPVVYSKIYVKNNIHSGYIYATAKDQWILGEKLDDMVLMILDFGLHNNKLKSFDHYGFEYSLN